MMDVLGMAKLYPSLRRDLHVTPGWATVQTPRHEQAVQGYALKNARDRVNVEGVRFVNRGAMEILVRCTGRTNVEEIYQSLLNKFGKDNERLMAKLTGFLEHAQREGTVVLSAEPTSLGVRVTGSEAFYWPLHLSVEVTGCCNVRCKHCYGSFEPAVRHTIPKQRLCEVLDELRAKGLLGIEITGGEPTCHPHLDDIMEYCMRHFSLVAFLTNGVALRDSTLAILAQDKEKSFMQMSIHGDECYHDYFCETPGSYKKTVDAIRRTVSAGIHLRIVMNVTYENSSLLDETKDYMKELGVHVFMAAMIDEEFGRAAANRETQRACSATRQDCDGHLPEGAFQAVKPYNLQGGSSDEYVNVAHQVMLKMRQWEQEDPGFIQFTLPDDTARLSKYVGNCGAGNRALHISSEGNVVLCPMACAAEVPALGNIYEQSMESILAQELARGLAELPSPKMADCSNCSHLATHMECNLRTLQWLMQEEPERGSCAWSTLPQPAGVVAMLQNMRRNNGDDTNDA